MNKFINPKNTILLTYRGFKWKMEIKKIFIFISLILLINPVFSNNLMCELPKEEPRTTYDNFLEYVYIYPTNNYEKLNFQSFFSHNYE